MRGKYSNSSQNRFPTHSRFLILATSIILILKIDKLYLVINPIRGSHGLPPNNHMGYQNLSQHMSIYNDTYSKIACYNPGRLTCLYIKVTYPDLKRHPPTNSPEPFTSGNCMLWPGETNLSLYQGNLPWSQEAPSCKLALVFHFRISILWIICLAFQKPNPC